MLNLGVLVSGNGTNLQAIIDSIENSYLNMCRIVAVVSNKPEAYALKRAEKHGIAAKYIEKSNYLSREEFESEIISYFHKYDVGLVILAGFTYILSDVFINTFKNKVINIHPSLVPSFCGKGCYGLVPHQKAIDLGVKITGATVHFVDTGTDTGPIILQKPVEVMQNDTAITLQKRVMEQAEWVILPRAIKLFAEGKLEIRGNKVIIID